MIYKNVYCEVLLYNEQLANDICKYDNYRFDIQHNIISIGEQPRFEGDMVHGHIVINIFEIYYRYLRWKLK